VCLSSVVIAGRAPEDAQENLDAVLAAYAAGDHAVVERTFARSRDFQRFRLSDRGRLERWLGPWRPDKAKLLLDVIARSADIAPAYTLTLLHAGQAYVLGRPAPPGSAAGEDRLEQTWHAVALAVLQSRFYDGEVERYLGRVAARRPAPALAVVGPPRGELARAIAQEQRCRVLHASARHDRLATESDFAAATPPAEREAAITCVRQALTRFEAAAKHADGQTEARLRAGWAIFQLGRSAEAMKTFEGIDAGDDHLLAYWLALFRGRTADALGDDPDAERAYRRALAAFPGAHSASIGLALSLFRMNRDDEAEEAASAVRRQSGNAVDPWELYPAGDARFLGRWLGGVRGLRP
jgi:hypothetical protein